MSWVILERGEKVTEEEGWTALYSMNRETWFYHADFVAHPARRSEIYFDFCSCPLPFHHAILLVALIF